KGHVFCKECILECLLAQKKDIQRKLAAHAAQQKQEKEEEEEKLMLQKARELDEFDQQNHGAMPQYSDKTHSKDKNGFHGANSVKATSYEEEALRTMKAFWLPLPLPKQPLKSYICPSCKVTLTNTLSLMALSSCGHVFCKKCGDKFMAVDKVCLVCNKGCKERNLIPLEKGGTGFAAHGDHLMATDFKHLGSGSGLGLVRPAAKT
ncbi:unnamed protein product, partial [Thlaspi arvense]